MNIETASAKAATPLMQQYWTIKERYADEIVFFRLGDFYEMFFDDAVRAAPLLEVALTQRQGTPMCGVPYHAMTSYLAKLIKAGLSVAIAEQLEDPKKTKGMVKRGVVRVMTPGTLVEDELLPSKANNFLVAIATTAALKGKPAGWELTAADVSTGRQWTGRLESDLHWNTLKANLASLAPSEILLVGEASRQIPAALLGRAVVRYEATPSDAATPTLAAIRGYLERDHAGAVASLNAPVPLPLETGQTLFLDETAIRHLELVGSSDPSKAGPTLLGVLDRCLTPLGSRLLRWWLLHPSTDVALIEARQSHVQNLLDDSLCRDELRVRLKGVADLERIAVRVQAGTASPRDLDALRQSLARLNDLCCEHVKPESAFFNMPLLRDVVVPQDLRHLLDSRLADSPPAKLNDGGVIRDGVNAELDELRKLRRSGKTWIAEMESAERARTGIGSLKVGYNDIFGYFIEVSRTNLSKVPPEWIRKQTMANGERYITPELKEQEEKIVGAEGKIRELELKLFQDLLHEAASHAPSLSQLAEAVACVDAVAALADVAVENNFVRPVVNAGAELQILNGRHPVIERQLGRDRFIPNDLKLDERERRMAVITGPNMAGKSTYLRQNALIVILAQMGSFVPAESASIGVVDKIFTRIGASDRLAQGQSTFMVEMQEVAALLESATAKSLLILDEVGRGTSTYDGVSIAWAVIEHLSKTTPRTLFATHYFELTQLPALMPGVFNMHATAKEWTTADGRKQVVFLYQIRDGAADRSYGIHVAEMAGLPDGCIARAREILKQLESGDHHARPSTPLPRQQLEFFSEHPVVEELKSLQPDQMTPLEALSLLSKLVRQIRS
jgi:DNA mismatch repair protein MutS